MKSIREIFITLFLFFIFNQIVLAGKVELEDKFYNYKGTEIHFKMDTTKKIVSFKKNNKSIVLNKIMKENFKKSIVKDNTIVIESDTTILRQKLIDLPEIEKVYDHMIDSKGNTIYSDGRFFVRFNENVSDNLKNSILENANANIVEKIGSELLICTANALDIFEIINRLSKMKEIKYVEPNFIFNGHQNVPDDTYSRAGSQWGLINTNAYEAWMFTTGASNITIAIIDSGVEPTHSDLSSKLITGYNMNVDATDPEYHNTNPNHNAHGTNCAGIASAITNNNQGVAGVCWQNKILAFKCESVGGFIEDAAIIKSFIELKNYALINPSEKIVANNSWGGGPELIILEDAIKEVWNAGVLVVASAGNDGLTIPGYPWENLKAYSLVVGSVDEYDTRCVNGNCQYGVGKGSHKNPEVVAPGVRIWSTDLLGTRGYNTQASPDGDYYSSFNGTSSAAPFVSGLAALIWSKYPSLTNVNIEAIIKNSSDKILWPYDHTTNYTTEIGYGRINMLNALAGNGSSIASFTGVDVSHSHAVFNHQYAKPGYTAKIFTSASRKIAQFDLSTANSIDLGTTGKCIWNLWEGGNTASYATGWYQIGFYDSSNVKKGVTNQFYISDANKNDYTKPVITNITWTGSTTKTLSFNISEVSTGYICFYDINHNLISREDKKILVAGVNNLYASSTITSAMKYLKLYVYDIGGITTMSDDILVIPDTTPPISVLNAPAIGDSSTVCTFTGTDLDDSGASGSGVKEYHYRLNGGTWNIVTANPNTQTFTITIANADSSGNVNIDYYAVDNLSNIEATRTKTVFINTLDIAWSQEGRDSQNTNNSPYASAFTNSSATIPQRYNFFPPSTYPGGNLVVDNVGNAYFVVNNTLFQLSPSGTPSTLVDIGMQSNIALGKYNHIYYFVHDPASNSYGLQAADVPSNVSMGYWIYRWFKNAPYISDLSVGVNGDIYYSSVFNGLRKIQDLGNTFYDAWGSNVVGTYETHTMSGLNHAIDSQGNVYITEAMQVQNTPPSTTGIRVKVYSPAGILMNTYNVGLEYSTAKKIQLDEKTMLIYLLVVNASTNEYEYVVMSKVNGGIFRRIKTGGYLGIQFPTGGSILSKTNEFVFAGRLEPLDSVPVNASCPEDLTQHGGPNMHAIYRFHQDGMSTASLIRNFHLGYVSDCSNGPEQPADINSDLITDDNGNIIFGAYNWIYAVKRGQYSAFKKLAVYGGFTRKYIAIGKDSNIYVIAGSTVQSWGNNVVNPVNPSALPAPYGTGSVSENGITIVPSLTTGTTGWNLYRSGSPFTLLNTDGPITASSFVDISATAGTDHCYIITQFDQYEQESEPSEPICISFGTHTITPTVTVSITDTITPTVTETLTHTVTPTLTQTMTVTPTFTATMAVVLLYKSGDTNVNSNSPHPQFRLQNNDSRALDLSKITIKYWYSFEGSNQAEDTIVDYAGRQPSGDVITGNTHLNISNVNYSDGQNRCLIVSFDLGAASIASSGYADINTRFNKTPDWSAYNQANDWSYLAVTDYTSWNKVSVYYDSLLIWGQEPLVATTTPTVTITVTLTPLITATHTPILDEYEEDNSYITAKTIINNESQIHLINPIADVDWVKFEIEYSANVSVETSDINDSFGDTILYLYNSVNVAENEIANNDDNGDSLFSKITMQLEPGIYYAKVSSFNNESTIGGYLLKLTIEAIPTPTLTPTNSLTETYTYTQTEIPSVTNTETFTNTFTPTNTITDTFTITSTPSYTETDTPSFTHTTTNSPTSTLTETPSITLTDTLTPTYTYTASPTSTLTGTATITPTQSLFNITLEYKSTDNNNSTNSPHPNFRVYNNSSTSLALNRVEIRYWYTFEGTTQAESKDCYYVGRLPSGTSIAGNTLLTITSGLYGDQNRYLKVTFDTNAGSLAQNDYVEIQTGFNKSDWSSYTQSNDFSYGNYTDWTNWNNVGVYIDGTLVWGTTPGGGTLAVKSKFTPLPTKIEALNETNVYNYPNPFSGETTIRFSLDKAQDVKIQVYDINSKLVWNKVINLSDTKIGINSLIWNGKNSNGLQSANGVYLLEVVGLEKIVRKKIALINSAENR